MNFLSQMFLPALAIGAAPLLIHLLNRRRYRTLEWAAMDFLREAIHRNRRFLVLRDLLLLALRTLAVLLFVLAMARPYRVAQQAAGYAGEPVHAVVVIDNSQSMGYTPLTDSLLETARKKAAAFLRDLPDGSRVSLVPMCDYAGWHGKDVYATKEDALEALGRIELVDRLARSSVAAEAAARACRAAKDLPTKRVVFLGDMQRETWGAQGLGEFFREIGDVQIAQVGKPGRDNTSVAEFRLREGTADAESPAVFLATVRHEGAERRENVRVTLKLADRAGEKLDWAVVQERRVDLLPGQSLEVMFEHRFEVAGTPGEPRFVAARVELTPDHLSGDDFRTLVVPVVAKVPVVFLDEEGRDETPRRRGETHPLRQLLAPRTSRYEIEKRLVEVRHRKPTDVSQDDLKDARLVAMAGVKAPTGELVRLLREYVEQGGVLLLAAGGEFDPAAWQTVAWADGMGILPAPLEPAPIGKVPPAEAVEAETFGLAPATMQDSVFRLEMPPRDLEALYLTPFFYKAVAVDEAAMEKLADAERRRLQERRAWLARNDQDERLWAQLERKGELTAAQKAQREADRAERRRLRPNWLMWSVPAERDVDAMDLDELLRRNRPRVMGRYDNNYVFAVRRDVGYGRIIMITTGCFPKWNSLAVGTSVLLLDQPLRSLLSRSLPERTFGPVNEIVIPIDSAEQQASFTFHGPDEDTPRPLRVEALSENTYGLILRDVERRGAYRVRRERSAGADAEEREGEGWEMLLAVNGPAAESELASVDEEGLRQRMGALEFRWVGPGESLRVEGVALVGRNYWKYLMVVALACLLVEMLFLAAPRLGGRSQ